jgi:hypothetical protein
MTILCNDADRPERCRRTQDRADIVRVGHLVEDEKHCTVGSVRQQIIDPDFLERLNLDDDSLMRSVIRYEAAKIGSFGKRNRDLLRELHE